MRRHSVLFQARRAHFIWLLAACAAGPAVAGTVAVLAPVFGSASGPVPGPVPDAPIRSEPILPLAPDASAEQVLSQEHAARINEDFPPNESAGLRSDPGVVVQRGKASWYGPGFHGRRSASGERFNMYSMTAAHPSLPLQSWVLVRNVRNNKTALVKVTDRGPYRSKRIIDVSYAAAKQLGFVRNGTAQIELRRLSRSEASQAAQSSAR